VALPTTGGAERRNVQMSTLAEVSDLPLLEFDPDEEAVLGPASTRAAGVDAPIAAVGCFFPELLDALPGRRELMVLSSLTPLWEIEW
jgi:hypothetical protein